MVKFMAKIKENAMKIVGFWGKIIKKTLILGYFPPEVD